MTLGGFIFSAAHCALTYTIFLHKNVNETELHNPTKKTVLCILIFIFVLQEMGNKNF